MGAIKEQVKDYLDKGIAVSMKAIEKTGNKVQELGEIGVLRYELEKLNSREKKLFHELGKTVYSVFSKDKKDSLPFDDENISGLLKEIVEIEKDIKKNKKLIDEKTEKKSKKK